MRKKQFVKILMIGMLYVSVLSLTSCKDDDTVQKSSEKELSGFLIAAGTEIFSGTLQEDGKTVLFVTTFGFDQKALSGATPTFDLSKGATSSPVSGVPQDFTKDVTYTVTAEDGSTLAYTVRKIDGTSSEASFLSFSINVKGLDFEGTIDDANATISLFPTANVWDELYKAIPTFTLSPGATANPASGVAQDFTQDVIYEITANDGTVRRWTVKRILRTGNSIDYFYLKPSGYDRIVGVIDATSHTVTIGYPVFKADFTPTQLTMAPEVIQISSGATVVPNWDVPCDFSKNVTYTVTAEDGNTQVWTIIAPKYYAKQKWYTDAARLFPAGGSDGQLEASNSIGLVGDYVAFSRTSVLLNRSDGSTASAQLNVTGVPDANGTHPPFFVANDDAGHLIGCSLGAWNADAFSIFKWTAYDQQPVKILNYVTPLAGDPPARASLGRKLSVIGDINGSDRKSVV
jgi:hypothetical protein